MRLPVTTIVLSLCLALSASAKESTSVSITRANVQKPSATSVAAKPWPQELSDVRPDPAAIWGKLENGLRYVILPTKSLPTRASLRLYVDVGSLMEADDQRGMAHFLEHMAFCGSKRFPTGQAIECLQRLGMKFGADSNARTNVDKTVYELEMPRTNEEVMTEGLTLLRDFFDGMLLDQTQIDRERGVILSEIVACDSAELRARNAGFKFMMPDSSYSKRDVLGAVADIKALKRQRFVDFYETWYTPTRAVVVAVGDFDTKLIERLIKDNFADAVARRGEQPNPAFGKVERGQKVTAHFFKSPDLKATIVRLSLVKPGNDAPDTLARERKLSTLAIANAMLNLRLSKIADNQSAPIVGAGAERSEILKLAEISGINVACRTREWKEALTLAEQELRRALLYGFSDTEFAIVKQAIGASFQAQADQSETRQPSTLADQIVRNLADNVVFSHPADDLEFCKTLLANLSKSDCEMALRDEWNGSDVKIWLQGNLALEDDAEQQMVDVYRASQKVPVTRPADDATAKWTYANFGPAGTIVKQSEQKGFHFTQAVFANNVRVNVKKTTYEKGKVDMLIRFGGGLLEMPTDKPGLDKFASATLIPGGLQAHSLNDMNRLLADKQYQLVFGVTDDAFFLAGAAMASSLETQLQVAAAYLTAPGYRPEAMKQFTQGLEANYATLEHTAEGAEIKGLAGLLRCDDPRFLVPSRETMEKFTLADVKAWLGQPLARSYMEVTIVGDIEPEAALQLVAKTLGTLPEREATKPAFTQARELKFPVGAPHKEIRFASETPRAISVVCWPTTGARDVSLDRRTRVLTDILRDRLRVKVRTALGATYSPAAFRCSTEGFPDFGFLQAELTVEPQRVNEIGALVAGIGAELAAGQISDDEFDRAMKPLLTSLEESAKNNAYWIDKMNNSQERPDLLEAARSEVNDYKSITKTQIEQLAKRLLSENKATIVSVAPTAAPSINQTSQDK